MIYLAPLQGFTEVFFRAAFQQLIGGIDKYFTPFFEFNAKGELVAPNKREINKLINQNQYLVPQLAAGNGSELIAGANFFIDNGFEEMNLNLGCPFPMLVKRQKGCGALPHTQATVAMLEQFYEASLPIKLSIKTRLGWDDDQELQRLLPHLNKLPIEELIIHLRLGKDQYKGDVKWSALDDILALTNLPIVANGDIVKAEQFFELQKRFPAVDRWMVGRGVLVNPLLVAECKGEVFTIKEHLAKFKELHDSLITILNNEQADQNQFMNAVKAFWFYHSQYYDNGKQLNKSVVKCNNPQQYGFLAKDIWTNILG